MSLNLSLCCENEVLKAMDEWLDNQKHPSSNFRKLLKERIGKANLRRKLTAEEAKRLNKLSEIADRLKRGENVQNRQLQTWLTQDEYSTTT